MDKKYKIGIIGCGGIANGKHMPSLKKLADVEMVAFCDIILSRAQEAKSKYGNEDSRVYQDYKEMLADKDIDIVHVCTPNRSHSFISIDAMEAGKHVMCEKPMAKTAAEAQAMVDAAKRTGKKLTIGYQGRSRAESLYLKELCQEGELGDIYFAKAMAIRRRGVPTWGVFLDKEEQGGGPLIDIGTHALDQVLWYMDNYEVSYVCGNAFRKLCDQTGTANLWGDWDVEKYTVEDSAFGFIKMKNGAVISLESSWALNILENEGPFCVLCGTKAGADFRDGLRINGVKRKRAYIDRPSFTSESVDFYGVKENDNCYADMRQWIDCIKNDSEPRVKPEQALVVTKILEAIYKSSETGMPVIF